MNTATTEYRGYTVSFREENEIWEAQVGDEHIGDSSLTKLKKKLDDFTKRESKYNKTSAYEEDWGGILRECVITSEDRDGESVWIKNSNNRKEKVMKTKLYKINDHNNNIINKIESIKVEIKTLKETKTEYHKKLQGVFDEL